jgi:hypothetical protein
MFFWDTNDANWGIVDFREKQQRWKHLQGDPRSHLLPILVRGVLAAADEWG